MMTIGLLYTNDYRYINYKSILLHIIFREISNIIVPSESGMFPKNTAAKPPIPTKMNVTNGSKGEWTSENDHLKEMQVRN